MDRYLLNQIQSDLKEKMVFLGGPRQIGKTTLAKSIIKDLKSYLNWDNDEHRSQILRKQFPNSKILVFDELHKFKNWRNYLKGIYDTKKSDLKILVTGSARLDLYRHGGDSLQGRYHYLRLYPLTVSELKINTQSELNRLLTLSGFPEPFFKNSKSFYLRWARQYRSRLIRDEVTSLERISDLAKLELLMERIIDLVGNPLSINNVANDLEINHKTAKNWLDVLERLYACFRISPFGNSKIKSVKKEQKLYLYDWSLIEDPGYRFENFVAVHLLKWVHYQQDVFGENYELKYFRDVEKREVDFVVCKKNSPVLFVECKYSSQNISDHLLYIQKKFRSARCVQVVQETKKSYTNNYGIELIDAIKFLNEFI